MQELNISQTAYSDHRSYILIQDPFSAHVASVCCSFAPVVAHGNVDRERLRYAQHRRGGLTGAKILPITKLCAISFHKRHLPSSVPPFPIISNRKLQICMGAMVD